MSVDIAERIASGSFILTIGQTLSLIIGTVFSFIIARLLGPSNYGLLSISLTYPLMISNLVDLGLSGVIARYVAEPSNERNKYAWTGALIRFVSSMIGGLLVYMLSDLFAEMLARPDIAVFIKMLSLYSCFSSILGPLSAVFNGLGKYKIAASINIVQYVVRGPLVITLIMMGLGVYGAVIAYSITYMIVTSIYLVVFIKTLKPPVFSTTVLKEMLYLALPLYIASIGDIVSKPIVDSIIAHHVLDYELGNYAVALNSLMPMGAVLGAISTAVLTSFPLIGSNHVVLKENAKDVAMYSSAVFTALGMCYLSVITPLIYILYGRSYANAPTYALLYSIGQVVPVILGSLVIGNYLLTIKATGWISVISIIRSLFIASLTYVLVPLYGVSGAALASSIGSILSSIIGLTIIHRIADLSIDIYGSFKVSMPSFISFTIAYVSSLHFTRLFAVFLTGFTVYIISYLLISPLFIERSVIKRIVELACGLEYIGWIIRPIARIYLKLVFRQ